MKIFYGVQGTGNGHISRSRTLAKALKKAGAQVDYLFTGRDPSSYFDMDDFGDYQTLQGMTFATSKGKINLRQTAQRIRAFRLIKDIRELNLSVYDCIISDFEPVSAWAAHHQKRDCLGISNQSICQSLKPKEYSLFAHTIMKYYAPVSHPVGLHWFHFGHQFLPPIIDKMDAATTEDGTILVYLPFESLNKIVTILSAFKHQEFICFHPDVRQVSHKGNLLLRPLARSHFTQVLMNCSGIITNTGFALISEALTLGKKILTKPVSGQFEQIYNANCLDSLDMACVMHDINSTTIQYWLEFPSQKPVLYPDVATEIASWIMSGQQEALSALSQRLWRQTQFPSHILQRIDALGYVM